MKSDYPPTDQCESSFFDDSWQYVDIDVVSWNNYSAGKDRYKEMAKDQYDIIHCEDVVDDNYFEFMEKPVLFGENGYEPYMDCDYTGFIKDLMATTFSGAASAGMSWDESKNRAHWFWMGKLRNFLESEFLYSPGVNLNAESWVPGREVSNSPAEKSEVIYLSKSIDDQKLIGVIMNRTWNYYTIGQGGDCDIVPSIDKLTTDLLNFNDVGCTGDPLKIPNMGSEKRYKIEYYDPVNVSLINQEIVYSGLSGNLHLESYPNLTSSRPIVFFKAWRKPVFGDEQSFFTSLPEDLNYGETKTSVPTQSVSITDSDDMEILSNDISYIQPYSVSIHPNPTEGVLTVNFSVNSDFSIEIFDMMGNVIYWVDGKGTSVNFDIESIEAGTYMLKVNKFLTYKLIKI